MPGSEDDLGLDLRLPWGRPERMPDASRSESPSSPPAPPASAQPDVVAAIDELRRDVKGLVSAVETRLDRLERRLSQVAAALPKLLTQIEADLASQQSATVKAVGKLQNVPLVDRLERRIDGAALWNTMRRITTAQSIAAVCGALAHRRPTRGGGRPRSTPRSSA